MLRRPGVFAAAALLLLARSAGATYSIVGSDSATRQTGGAGTSCLGGSDVYIIYGAVPEVGTVHTQAQYNRANHDRTVQLLEQGLAPADLIATVTAPTFDANPATRQYGAVDVTGRVAAYTGAMNQNYAGDRQGRAGSFTYSVQGNILTGAAVLEQAASAFEASGCDLAERLLRALEAGAENGQGDNRCTDRGIPSDSAFIEVEAPGTALGDFLELHVRSSGAANPLVDLRAQFDAWRADHPCPAPNEPPTDAGIVEPSDAGGTPSGDAGGEPSDAGTPSGDAGDEAGSMEPPADAGGEPRDGGNVEQPVTGERAAASPGDSGGCGCELPGSAQRTTPAAWLVLAIGAWAARRCVRGSSRWRLERRGASVLKAPPCSRR